MKYYQKLVGKSVYLSPMHVDDADIYVRWLNDFHVTDGTGATTRLINLKNEREWIERTQSESEGHQFALCVCQMTSCLETAALWISKRHPCALR